MFRGIVNKLSVSKKQNYNLIKLTGYLGRKVFEKGKIFGLPKSRIDFLVEFRGKIIETSNIFWISTKEEIKIPTGDYAAYKKVNLHKNEHSMFEVEFFINSDEYSHNLSDFKLWAIDKDSEFQNYCIPIDGKVVQIEIAGECNLKCVMCPQAFGIFNENMVLNDLGLLNHAFNDNAFFELNHQGETLLSPMLQEVFNKIGKNKTSFFNTNGLLLNKEKTLVLTNKNSPLRLLRFSIDGGSKGSYKNIRGANFSLVRKNLIAFKEVLRKIKFEQLDLSIGYVAMRENIADINEVVELAEIVGANLEVWPLSGGILHGGKDWIIEKKDFKFVYEEQILSESEWEKFVRELKRKYINSKVQIDIPLLLDKSRLARTSDCPYFDMHSHFNSAGSAQHCCHQTTPIYNWKENTGSFFENKRVKEMKALSEKDIIPKECSQSRCSFVNGRLHNESSSAIYKESGQYLNRKWI